MDFLGNQPTRYIRHEIKSSGKNSILNQFKIEGGGGPSRGVICTPVRLTASQWQQLKTEL